MRMSSIRESGRPGGRQRSKGRDLALVFFQLALAAGAAAPFGDGRGPTIPASDSPRRLSLKLSLKDWDLASAGAIRFGRVAAVRKPDGDILSVHFFSDVFRTAHSAGTKPEVFNGDYFLISNFDSPPPNTLGGQIGPYFRAPSSAGVEVRETADGRSALVLSTAKAAEGFCGAWIHLFETGGEPESRAFLNTELFSHLVFWARADLPGLDVTLKLADSSWLRRDDAESIGSLESFLPGGGIDTEWRLVSLPLASLPQTLDRRALASLVFEVSSPGSHRLEVKGLALVDSGRKTPPTPPPPFLPSRATWVWNTEAVLRSAEERETLLAFLVREKIDLVYLALPYADGAVILDEALLVPFLEKLAASRIRTHALFGDKTLVLAENHAFVRKTVKDIIAFNGRAPESARFSGLHVDIEPYLCLGFNGRARGVLMKNFVFIMAEAAGLARSAGLVFGADIPPWFDMINEYSEDVLTTTHGGRTKPVYEHLIDICDQVTLMDYRTASSGLNGTIALAVGELAYAAMAGKKVYVGLETTRIEDERLFTIRGTPAYRLEALPKAPFYVCVSGAGPEPILHILTAEEASAFQSELRNRTGSGTIDFWWPVHYAPLVAGSSISFAFHGPDDLLRVIRETTGELSLFPSFAGIAVHDANYHRRLMASEKSK